MRATLLGLLLTASCGAPCAQPNVTRCNGSLVELCGSNLKWQRVMECAQVRPLPAGPSGAWVCKTADAGCTCVRVPEVLK